jgi:beta-galactosidase
VKQIGEEFARAGTALANTHVESEVAILHSYESRWAIEWQPQTIEFDPVEELVRYYRPLRELSQSIDIVPPSASLAKYKLVVAPAMNLLTEADSKNLMDYVTGGGNLVFGPRSVMKDDENSLQTNRQPGPLVPLLGGRVEQFYATKRAFPVEGAWGSAEARIWAELLSVKSPDTTVLMRYGKSNGWLDGQPAVITRKVGKGSITYIGVCMDDAGMQRAAKWMIDTSGVQAPLIKVPVGVEASVRYGDKNAVHILVNFSSTPQTITLPAPMDDVLHGGMTTTVKLPVYGVAVLNTKR